MEIITTSFLLTVCAFAVGGLLGVFVLDDSDKDE